MTNKLFGLSVKKILNIVLVYCGYILSSFVKRPIVFGMPFSLSVEPVSYCNLKCRECPVGDENYKRKKGKTDIEMYRKLIDEMHPYLINLFLYFLGEPLLNRQLPQLIEYATKNKVYTALSTNGNVYTHDMIEQLISAGLKKIIVSVDGANQQSYQQYRVGGRWCKTIRFIELMAEKKKQLKSNTPKIEVQFLVLKTNEHQMNDIKKIILSSGASKLVFKSAQINHTQNMQTLLTSKSKYARYKKKGNSYIIKSKRKNRCFRSWNSAVVTFNGNVLPCCFDKYEKHVTGSINDSSFKDIWFGLNFMKFRNIILSNRKSIAMCNNCTEGLNLSHSF